jgi:hypothetical protein
MCAEQEPGGPTFDSAAAAQALNAIDLRACSKAGPTGPGHARVTFLPSGAVSQVAVDAPELQGTATGRCVAQAYRRVQVAPFAGPPLTVGKRFVVPADS